MPVYIYHFTIMKVEGRTFDAYWWLMDLYINTTNSKSFEKYKITPIDAKIISYFLNNVCF